MVNAFVWGAVGASGEVTTGVGSGSVASGDKGEAGKLDVARVVVELSVAVSAAWAVVGGGEGAGGSGVSMTFALSVWTGLFTGRLV